MITMIIITNNNDNNNNNYHKNNREMFAMIMSAEKHRNIRGDSFYAQRAGKRTIQYPEEHSTVLCALLVIRNVKVSSLETQCMVLFGYSISIIYDNNNDQLMIYDVIILLVMIIQRYDHLALLHLKLHLPTFFFFFDIIMWLHLQRRQHQLTLCTLTLKVQQNSERLFGRLPNHPSAGRAYPVPHPHSHPDAHPPLRGMHSSASRLLNHVEVATVTTPTSRAAARTTYNDPSSSYSQPLTSKPSEPNNISETQLFLDSLQGDDLLASSVPILEDIVGSTTKRVRRKKVQEVNIEEDPTEHEEGSIEQDIDASGMGEDPEMLQQRLWKEASLEGITVVSTKDEALRALRILESPSVAVRVHAVDTEVIDLDLNEESPVHHGKIICFSVYTGPDVDFGGGSKLWVDCSIPLDGGETLLSMFRSYLTNPSIKKCFHNYSFDFHMFANHGIFLDGFYADTMHMARLYDTSTTKFSLEYLSQHYNCSTTKVGMKTLFGTITRRKDGQVSKSSSSRLPDLLSLQNSAESRTAFIQYSATDTVTTWLLREKLEKLLRNRSRTSTDTLFDFYIKFYRPFAQCLVDMERKGFYINRDSLVSIEKIAEAQVQQAEETFRRWAIRFCEASKNMNISSGVQKQHFMFGTKGSVKVFDCPNTEGYIEEGRTKPKKTREFGLIGLGIPNISKTKKGQPSVTAAVIQTLAGKPFSKPPKYGTAYDYFNNPANLPSHLVSLDSQGELATIRDEGVVACEAFSSLAAANAINTLLSTFIKPLQTLTDSNSRIHCSLNLNTETGRLSSRSPNLQNQPALEKDIFKIRKAFMAAPGKNLIVADYGQLELRVLAHMTKCKSMIEAFESGGDFHSRTALGMYDYIRDAVDNGSVLLEWDDRNGKCSLPMLKDKFATERKKAKILNFSIAYGKTAHGLSKDWNVSLREAEETVERWYRDRPEVRDWQQRTIKEAHVSGSTRTLMGRYRQLKGTHGGSIFSDDRFIAQHWERAAINTPIQGGAADIVMMAMLKLHEHKRFRELGWSIILQVHDEIISEGPAESSEEAMQIVQKCMRHPFSKPLLVDLIADAKCAQSWYEAK